MAACSSYAQEFPQGSDVRGYDLKELTEALPHAQPTELPSQLMASLSLSFPICKVDMNDGVRLGLQLCSGSRFLLPFPLFPKKRPTSHLRPSSRLCYATNCWLCDPQARH